MYVVHVVQGVHLNVRSRAPVFPPVSCRARQCHAAASSDVTSSKDVIYLMGDDKGSVTRDSSSSRCQPVATNTTQTLRKAAGMLSRIVTPQLQLQLPRPASAAVKPRAAITLGPPRSGTITLNPPSSSSILKDTQHTQHAAGSGGNARRQFVIHLPDCMAALSRGKEQLPIPPGASNLPIVRKSTSGVAAWKTATGAAVPATKPVSEHVSQLIPFPRADVHAVLRRPDAANSLQLSGAAPGLEWQLLQLAEANSDKSHLISFPGTHNSSTKHGLSILRNAISTVQLRQKADPPAPRLLSGPFGIISIDAASSTAGAHSSGSSNDNSKHIIVKVEGLKALSSPFPTSNARLAAVAAAPVRHQLFSGGNLEPPNDATGSSGSSSRGGSGDNNGHKTSRVAAEAAAAAAASKSLAAAAPAALSAGGSSGALLPASMRLARMGIALMGLAAAVALAAIMQEESTHRRSHSNGSADHGSSSNSGQKDASQMTNNAVAAAALASHGGPASAAAPGGINSSSSSSGGGGGNSAPAAAALDVLDTPGYHDWMEKRLQSALQQFTDEQNMLRAELSMLQAMSSSSSGKAASATVAKALPTAAAASGNTAEYVASSEGTWATFRRWFGGGNSRSSSSGPNMQAHQQPEVAPAAAAAATSTAENLSPGNIAARIAEINEELASLDVLKAALSGELEDQQQQRRRQQVQQISQQYGVLADSR